MPRVPFVRRFAPALASLAAVCAVASWAPAEAQAPQAPGFDFTYPGEKKLRIAIPKPIGGSGAAAEFYSVLENDLRLSGWFELVDPAAHTEPSGTGVRPGQFRYEDWQLIGADVLGKTLLQSRAGNQLYAEIWTYDANGSRRLGARSFTASGDHARMLAHKVANEIIYRVTMRDGPFNTRFAVAGSFTGNKEIYVVDFDGYNLRPVTKNGSINIEPAWDRKGGRIAFTSFMQGEADLYVANLADGVVSRVSARSGLDSAADWHPTRNLLAVTLAIGGDPDIFTIDATSGRQLGRLTKSAGTDTSAVFSPDGTRIAFVSDRSGKPQIYVADKNGGNPRRVTFQGNYNTEPAWNPDGDKIAFVGRDGNFDVFVVDADGSNLTRLTQGEGDNEGPTWSPDGYYVAFASTRSGSSHIWASTVNGRHQVQLTKGRGGYTNPDWSPKLTW
jgi:TolB protein